MCRVDAYALSTASIPESGHIGLQYSNTHGVCNIVFPVTMKTYLYPEAPEVESEDEEDHFPSDHANSATSFDTAEEFGYDREVLQEAYAWQHRANKRLERGKYVGNLSQTTSSSCSTDSSRSSSSEGNFYLPRDYSPAPSFESDRSWKLY